jgi:hypothetical protein
VAKRHRGGGLRTALGPLERSLRPARAGTAKPCQNEAEAVASEKLVPSALLKRLRTICLRLPEAYEEPAWVGTRFMIKKRNFAHVLRIDEGWPPAYARAARQEGPLDVVTFRVSDVIYDGFADARPRYFQCPWGTRWGTKVVGMALDRHVDWVEAASLLAESYRLLAPKPRKRRA